MVRKDIRGSSGKFLDFISSHSVFRGLPVYVRHFVEPLLPIGVQGLQRAFHLLRSRAIVLTPFHSVPLYFKIGCSHSSHVCLSFPVGPFPCVVTFQAISVDFSSPIVTTCPNHLKYPNSIVCLRGIIPNPNV
jgi:hypothetical protein